jgi:hypothetical protein
MPDDLKAKHYQQILSRFLNTKRTLPDESPVTPLPELIEEKRKKKTKSVSVPTRHSKRTVKTPKKIQFGSVVMEIACYNPNKPGSYGGVNPLVRYSNSSVATAKNWLSSQDAYTLHKPVRRNFPRRKIYAKCINDLFQADLADMQQLSRYNDGYSFILTCIDVLTKRTFAIPLKNKRGSSVAVAFLNDICRGNTVDAADRSRD